MSLDEEALQTVANGGSMDLEKWTGMVDPLLERLENIVYNVFPMPKVPPGSYNHEEFQQPSQTSETTTVPPESSNKENTAPGGPQTPPAPTDSLPPTERVPDSQPQSTQQPNDSLPPPLALLLSSIESAIQTFFLSKPPHTIQRFAELILNPTAHYRTLPAYLRAVDRVVSVTSGIDVFPSSILENATPSGQSNGLAHPTNNASTYLTPDYATGLGSDESLGGALLTPIPWLTNASFEGEEASTLDDEQAVPTQPQEMESGDNNIATTTTTTTTFTDIEEAAHRAGQRNSTSPPAESPDEIPHARGPALLGVQDMGLQDGKGVEVNLGDQTAQTAIGDGASDALASASIEAAQEANATDGDGDIVLDDSTPKEQIDKTEDSTETTQKDFEATDSTQALDPEKKN
ncbi:Protein phosphatase 4 core regulatory subunit R2 [Penicillium atrosanguineum]|uniref:Protein phosphatase 4 core regulatory subunit R2 n=1 Tax=Penicillium atrosanguineum TaxID=1132637 RepID=A0A9W9H3Z2_9EURO|nr:Protein phosphatase 4 core regulatory subunit R2 [Penicillium atrosanguineum]KAJ5136298.1 Protein phosphatase 4 core regulatory subunit R2 [Penicillium atrosanguineum]KAJ5303327.1 Protein phosphatase 4 core regulatory subunit R2 [Penicillium atrosanguineum]